MILTKTRISVAGMAALAVASFVYMDHLGLETGVMEHVRTVSMAVPDTNGLVIGSRVLLRGVQIGHVTDITSSAEGASVAMKYDDGYRIPADSRFRVDNLSALGEAYVAVTPDTESGPYLANHATVNPAEVTEPTTFKELSARLTRMLEQVDPDKIRDVFHELNVSLPDDTQVLGNLNHAGELLATMITNQADSLTTVFKAMQPLLLRSGKVPADLANTTPTIAQFGSTFGELLNGIRFAQGRGPTTVGIRDGAGPFLVDLQGFLDKNATDLHTLGVDLLPGVRAGAAAMSTVNVGQVLDNALAATDSGDSLTIHLRVPGK
ncbi:MlaD family protein [Nocardia jiangxiensis]|uniref:MlaD family protein n=1 Tax=Nocardia jiangxiensis TaxID=282685 RepID=A0ABW6S1B2_9NOCA|nr:MlaD family protein [Nocardia jiangxiensis]